MRTSRRLILALLAVVTSGSPADAQFGRGKRAYRAQETKAYQYGFRKTYEIAVVNASLQDLEFRLAAYKDELQKWYEPGTAWMVEAGTFGTINVMALDMQGHFRTRRGVKVPARLELGAYYATFYVDEEILREYERRDPKGAIAIRTFEGYKNPDIPERRLTTLTDSTRRVRRGLELLRTARVRPGREGEFLKLKGSSFGRAEVGVLDGRLDDDERGGATSGRLRQPGEELVVVNVVDEAGEIPAGARFTARVGHGLAYRTEYGDIDGKGRIKLYTTRDDNVMIDITISGSRLSGNTRFSIRPSEDDSFNIRLR